MSYINIYVYLRYLGGRRRRGGLLNNVNGLNNNAIVVANGNNLNAIRRRNNVGPIVVVTPNNGFVNNGFINTLSPFINTLSPFIIDNAFINTRRGAGQFCLRNIDCDAGFSCVIDPDCNDLIPLRNIGFRRRRRMGRAIGIDNGFIGCDRICAAIVVV